MLATARASSMIFLLMAIPFCWYYRPQVDLIGRSLHERPTKQRNSVKNSEVSEGQESAISLRAPRCPFLPFAILQSTDLPPIFLLRRTIGRCELHNPALDGGG